MQKCVETGSCYSKLLNTVRSRKTARGWMLGESYSSCVASRATSGLGTELTAGVAPLTAER